MVARWSACLSRHHVVCPLFSSMWRVQCSDLLRRLQRPSSWWCVQYFVADHAVRDFRLSLSSIAVADGRVLVVCHFSFVVDRRGRRTWFLIMCHSCVNWWNKILLSCFLPCDCHSSQQLGFSQHALAPGTYFYNLVLRTDGSVSFAFGKGGSGVLANCSFCGTEATLSFLAGPVCSGFSAEACAILHALCWSRQHQQVCHFSSLLLLSDSRSVLSSIFLLISNFVADLAGTVFSLLLFYQTTMSPRTLVSPGKRRGWWAGQTGSATRALCNPL